MKRNDRKSGSGKKALILMVSLVAILAVSVGGVLAWLATSSGEVKNTFAPGKTDIEIEEKFENNVKKDVKVKNSGSIPVYANDNWVKGRDGFWYYTKPIAVGSETSAVVSEAKVTFPEGNGYKMDLEVMAQSIQAEPKDAVEGAWTNVTVNADGSLNVQ